MSMTPEREAEIRLLLDGFTTRDDIPPGEEELLAIWDTLAEMVDLRGALLVRTADLASAVAKVAAFLAYFGPIPGTVSTPPPVVVPP